VNAGSILGNAYGRRSWWRIAVAVTAATLLLPLTALPGWASLTGAGVDAGKNITVFHNIDFVAIFGYGPVGDIVTVDVIRDGVTIGTATGPTVDTPEGPGLEVNHGPVGDPQPGDCWEGHTPDIQPGDRIVVTQGADTDEVTVDDIRFTEAPFEDPTNGDILVRGIAKQFDGTPIPASRLDSAEFREGQFRGTPDEVVDTPGVAGGFTIVYHAPYELERNRDNLNEAQRKQALLGDGHAIGFGHVEPLPLESMLVDGVAELPGPALGCEASPSARYAVTAFTPASVNAATIGGGVTLSGVSQDAAAVSVSLNDEDPNTAAVVAHGTLSAPDGTQTWSASFSADQIATLADGTITATGSYTVCCDSAGSPASIGGLTRSILKDTVVPAAPTASPPGGLYRGTQSVELTAEPGAQIRYTTGLDPASTPDPTRTSTLYTGGISVTATETVKAIAIDRAGNISSTSSSHYEIDNTAPDTTITSAPAARSRNKNPSFGFTSNDANSTFQCSLTDHPAHDAYSVCTSAKSYTALKDGTYIFKVRATDAAGNTDPSPATFGFTIDTTTPVMAGPTVSPDPFNHGAGRRATIRYSTNENCRAVVSVVNAAGKVVKRFVSQGCSVGQVRWSGKNANGSLVPTGTYRAHVAATDAAGNVVQRSTSFRVT
jgi:hypothetical protein